jgi:hypothetical protein
MPNSQTPSNPLSDIVSRTHLAPRQAFKSLTLWPLRLAEAAQTPVPPAYQALGTAFDEGTLRVDEVDERGQVPHVRVSNLGEVAVLVLFGEEIRGAKQNRIANASFLVPGKSDLVLDVSCVEAGRWHRGRGERFRKSDAVLSNAIRRKMAGKVERARASGRGFDADQGQVWNEIGSRIELSGTASRTQAYADYEGSRSTDLETMTRAFHPIDGQVGFVASIGDEVAGLEVVGRPDVFAAAFRALLRAYAIDAVDAALVRQLESERSEVTLRFETPESFLDALARTHVSRGPSLGMGDDLRLKGAEVAGCALEHGEIVHLTAFPA